MYRSHIKSIGFDLRVLVIAMSMLAGVAALLAWAPRASAQEVATPRGDSALLVTRR